MLVRIKLLSTTTSANLVASMKTIVEGNMTVSGSAPTNLTGVDNANSIVYGTAYTNSNNKYSVSGDVITKVHATNSSYNSGFELNAGTDLEITGFGDPSSLTTPHNVTFFYKDLTTSYLDVIVNDKIFAINQVVGNRCVIIADLVSTSFVTSAFPDTILQMYEFTTESGPHDEVEFAKIYDDTDGAYVSKTSFNRIHSMASDHIARQNDTVIPLSSAMVGSQLDSLFPVLGIKGIANTPIFSGGGLLNDGNGNYYYVTGKTGYYGTNATGSVYTDVSAGSQIVLEVQ